MVEWAGSCVTFNECRATPCLVPPWDYSGAQPTSDTTKLCLPGVREQAREWPGSHTAVFMAFNIIICMSFPCGCTQSHKSHGSEVWKSRSRCW